MFLTQYFSGPLVVADIKQPIRFSDPNRQCFLPHGSCTPCLYIFCESRTTAVRYWSVYPTVVLPSFVKRRENVGMVHYIRH